MKLTEKNRQVLRLMLAGRTSKEIGTQLGMSYRTVEAHRSRVYKISGAANIMELTHKLYSKAITKNLRHDITGGLPVCPAAELVNDTLNLERLA